MAWAIYMLQNKSFEWVPPMTGSRLIHTRRAFAEYGVSERVFDQELRRKPGVIKRETRE